MIREPVAQVQRTYESVADQRNSLTSSTTTTTTRAAAAVTTATRTSTAGKIILNNLRKANITKSHSIPTTIAETDTNQLDSVAEHTSSTKRSQLSSTIQQEQQPKLYLIRVRKQELKTNQTERKVPQTHVIRVPFLPGSEPSTTPVKHTLPPAVSLVNHTTPVIPFRTEPNTSITANVYNYDSISSLDPNISPTNTSAFLSSMTATQDPTRTSLPLAIQSIVQVSRPMSLTSMAGVQLTEADISQTDMSGAMPIATVEEINVPVFIDEYLQEIQSTSTTNQNGKGENGNEKICITNDEGAFDNFEFDIGMILEDNIGQQMCQSNASGHTNNSNNNSFTNTTNNNNTNYNINNNNNNMNTMINDFDLSAHSAAANNHNNHYDNNDNNNNIENLDLENSVKTEIKFEDEFNNEEQYHVSLTALQDEESINMNNFSLEVDGLPFDAINFGNTDNNLIDCVINSQQDPQLSDTAFPSNSSELWFSNEEPQVPADFDDGYYNINSQQLLDESLLINVEDEKSFINMQTNSQGYGSSFMIGVGGGNVSCENGCKSLKRTAAMMAVTTTATPTITEVLLKRPKLQLNTKLREPLADAPINTPDVLNIIADLAKNYEHSLNNNSNHSSTEDITQNLIDSITEASVDAEGDANTSGSIIYELYAPDTPQSNISHSSTYTEYTSNTNFTGSFNTAPTSPAPSNCSTSQHRYSVTTTNNGSPLSTTTSTEKKRRGRPSKEHSEIPSRSYLDSLPESERKLLLDRAKNNEASRISRRKNKDKEYAEREQEEILEDRNRELKEELSHNEWISNKLKRKLQRRHFQKSDC